MISRTLLKYSFLLALTASAEAAESKWFPESTSGQNQVQLLVDGPQFYPVRLELIRSAKHTIDLTTFLWQDDEAGLAVANALADAARRGVRVRTIVDGMNNKVHDQAYRILKKAGAPVMIFSDPREDLNLQLHVHEKVMVVDGAVALVGGANLCEEYMIGGARDLWHDLELLVRGPTAADVQTRFDATWDILAENDYRRRDGYANLLNSPTQVERVYPILGNTPSHAEPIGSSHALYQYNQPYLPAKKRSRATVDHYASLIDRAERSLILYTPYFVLHHTFLAAIHAALDRNVKVTIYTNSPETNDMQQFIALAPINDYPELLAKGARIFEMQDRTLHAKAFLIDDEVLSVGSNNFTHRSFMLNGEANFLTDDAGAVAVFRSMAEKDVAKAIEMTPAEVERQKVRFIDRLNIFLGGLFRKMI